MIDPLEHPGGIQSDAGTVDDLPVRIIADTEYLRILRIIDVQIEVVSCEDPVEVSGSELGQRDSRAGDHTLKLVVGTGFKGICEGGYLGLHIRIGDKHGDDLPVVLVKELDGMRERTVSAVLMSPEIPEGAVKESLGRLRKEVVLLPCDLIDVEHYELGDLGAVGLIEDIAGVRWVRPQGMHRVIEVQDTEVRRHLVPVPVLQELVIYVLGQRGVLVVVYAHGVALGHHLVDERLID